MTFHDSQLTIHVSLFTSHYHNAASLAYISIDSKKRLLMFFSSEEYKAQGFNQIIAHRISTDGGKTWSDDVKDVAVNDNIKRPGMPTVAKLPDGRYVMCNNLVKALRLIFLT